MKKRIIRISIIVVILSYLVLYFAYTNGYYEKLNAEKRNLTEEMIKKYEEDLKNGLDVSKIDYTVKMEDFSNVYTKVSIKLSKKIENLVDGGIKYIFKKLSSFVGE